MKRVKKPELGLLVTFGAVIIAGMLVALGAQASPTQAQDVDQAMTRDADDASYMVVEFTDGTSSARVITWTTPVSRVQALELAGFEVEHNGDTVCSIEGDGCPADDCWGCGRNNWWQGRWLAGVWDGSEWPPPELIDGDVIGFHNGSSWTPPEVPASTYMGIGDAFEWLRPLQSEADGSYSSPFGHMGPTTDMAVAVVANSDDPSKWHRQATSPSLMDFVSGPDGTEYANTDASTAGKLAVTLAAAQHTSRDSSGVCWPALGKAVMDYYVPETGAFYTDTVDQAGIQSWAMLGVAAFSETIPVTATNALVDMANEDGGWGWSSAFGGSDTMVTAQAIQVLAAAGVPTTSASIQNGLTYLKGNQNDDGGFSYSAPGTSDVDSTAYAVQAIVAAGESPITGTWRTLSGTTAMTPISYLLSVQLPDGSFPAYNPTMATQHALPALLQRPFPLAVSQVPTCPTWQIYLPLIARSATQ